MDEDIEAALMQAGAKINALQREVTALRKDADRYRLMRENIDFTDNGDGTGFYWHNQRGEFAFEYLNDPDGAFRPTFESVIDAAVLASKSIRVCLTVEQMVRPGGRSKRNAD